MSLSLLPFIKDDRLLKLIDFIKKEIKGTYYNGHIYLVGGTVRDAMLNHPIKNINIAVDIPSGGVSFANFISFRNDCHITNKNPTINVSAGSANLKLLNGNGFDDFELNCVVTKSDHSNSYSGYTSKIFTDIKGDAAKRDLTINAIYYDITNDIIIDPTENGIKDLASQTLRCPDIKNLADDPLRILRIIRFSSELNFSIEKKTWFGMIDNADNILTVPQTKVTDEINKILLTKKPSIAIRKIIACNQLCDWTLPAINYLNHVFEDLKPKKTVFDHTMEVLDFVKPDLELRLAALYHDIGKTKTYKQGFFKSSLEGAKLVKTIMSAMKYPSDKITNVVIAISLHDLFFDYKDKIIPRRQILREFRKSINDRQYELVMNLMDANNKCRQYGQKPHQVDNIKKKIDMLVLRDEKKTKSSIKIPINGRDIIKNFNLKSGPIIGRLLKKAKEEFFKNPKMTKEELFDNINDIIKKKKLYEKNAANR